MWLRVILAATGAFILSAAPQALAGQTQVAVAANFTAPAKDIAAEANRFGQEDEITVITLDWRLQPLALV